MLKRLLTPLIKFYVYFSTQSQLLTVGSVCLSFAFSLPHTDSDIRRISATSLTETRCGQLVANNASTFLFLYFGGALVLAFVYKYFFRPVIIPQKVTFDEEVSIIKPVNICESLFSASTN